MIVSKLKFSTELSYNLPLVIYRTTRIIMPTLLNRNAVNSLHDSLARSANGGFGILCRRLNDLCRSICLRFEWLQQT